jgi:hypothetical protein
MRATSQSTVAQRRDYLGKFAFITQQRDVGIHYINLHNSPEKRQVSLHHHLSVLRKHLYSLIDVSLNVSCYGLIQVE